MANRFSDRLAQLSQARSVVSDFKTYVSPLLASEWIAGLELIGDALANIETDLKAASDTLDTPPPDVSIASPIPV